MKRFRYSLIAAIILLFSFSVPAAAITIDSPYAIVIDAKDGGPLFEKNADYLRPIASTSKIMSLYLVFEAIDKGQITMDTAITISPEMHQNSINTDWSNVPLEEGKSYTVRQLIEATCVVSGCGSIMTLGDYIDGSVEGFVAHMNQKAQEMELNATFDDATGVSGNSKMSARSLAKLTYEIIKNYPEIVNFTSLTRTTIDGKTYNTTNELLPGGDFDYLGADGVKTGTTTPAGKCLVGTAKRNDTRIITVVLAASTYDKRYMDTVNLLNFGFNTAPLYPLIFKDVATNTWYFTFVETAYNQSLVDGTGEYIYEPQTNVTRAMFVTVLGRIWEAENGPVPDSAGSAFPDVKNGSWYHKYVDWANANNVVNGFEDGTFRPDEIISREQMMRILYNYNTFINGKTDISTQVLNTFSDSGAISQWAVEGAAWCVYNDIINGVDSTHIEPRGTATRAQMAKVFVEYTN